MTTMALPALSNSIFPLFFKMSTRCLSSTGQAASVCVSIAATRPRWCVWWLNRNRPA